jgi:hypothetical protein
MEKESHGEEKEEEREIEDLKRASLALRQRYQSFGFNYAWRLNEVRPLLL